MLWDALRSEQKWALRVTEWRRTRPGLSPLHIEGKL